MISLDYSVIYQVILFFLLWIVLSKILFRPFLDLLEERERRTIGAQHDATDLEREGTQLRAQYEDKIAQAQAAGYAAKEAVLQEGRQQRERLLSQAREEAASMLEAARREVEGQMEKERQLAAAEAGVVAQQMVHKILGRDVA